MLKREPVGGYASKVNIFRIEADLLSSTSNIWNATNLKSRYGTSVLYRKDVAFFAQQLSKISKLFQRGISSSRLPSWCILYALHVKCLSKLELTSRLKWKREINILQIIGRELRSVLTGSWRLLLTWQTLIS